MKRLLVPAALVAVLAVPATSLAAPSPTSADRREARSECAALKRAAETRKNFASVVRLETATTTRKAFTDCVKERRAQARQERREARRSAVEACRSEHPRESRGEARSAFGRCVASRSQTKNREADAEQRERTSNPARACRAEQEASREDFAAAYGNRPNAFGKCVSQKPGPSTARRSMVPRPPEVGRR